MSYKLIRGIIIWIGFFVILVAYFAENRILAFALVALFSLFAAVILRKNLNILLNMEDKEPSKVRFLENLSSAGIAYLLLCIAVAILQMQGIIPLEFTELIAALLVAIFMIGFGNIAPKIPYNKFMGFRLPWTLLDEQTWIVAHRVLGYLSIPLAIVYIAMVPYVHNLTRWTVIVFVILWVGGTALISALFYFRKFK